MNNKQPKTKQNLDIEGIGRLFPVAETFHSIQGEGPHNGKAAFFIRMAGCNNRCYYCDTDYTQLQGKYSAVELTLMAEDSGAKLVVITGGEPLLYDISALLHMLVNHGMYVQIETAGTVAVPGFPYALADIVCSPKTGRIHALIRQHAIRYRYTLKAGQIDPEDGLPLYSAQLEGRLAQLAKPEPGVLVEVSPMDEDDEDLYKENLNTCIEVAKKFNYRLNLQMHKIIGVR